MNCDSRAHTYVNVIRLTLVIAKSLKVTKATNCNDFM